MDTTNMPTDASSLASVTKFADHAAVQSDRWLFIVLLVVVFAGAVIALRWMASQNAKAFATYRDDMQVMRAEITALHEDRIKATERFSEELRAIVRGQAEDARSMLRDHATVLNKNSDAMGAVQAALRELQNSCARSVWNNPRQPNPHPPQAAA